MSFIGKACDTGTRTAIAVGRSVALSACAPQQHIVAIGDVHGDLDAARTDHW
jgi:hypothetical protein